MIKEIKLKSYYADELKNYGFILNDETGIYEYKNCNRTLIAIKSWNYNFVFCGIAGNEVFEVIDVMLKLDGKFEIEYDIEIEYDNEKIGGK
ncbi:MAG: hypothetical protein RSB77_06285 [Bacilli bacterium]